MCYAEIKGIRMANPEFIYIPVNWSEIIKEPDWYFEITKDFRELLKKAKEESDKKEEQIKQEAYRFFELHLEIGDIALGTDGPNWDVDRKPIDTIVIHHTSEPPGLSWQKLSAIHLLRLYAPYYASPPKSEASIKRQLIFSHHFKNDRQVFYAYHWMVRENGKTEKLLNGKEIGWQAGNWDVNCRSVAICLDNDYENSLPSESMIEQTADLISKNYPSVDPSRIFGHQEINPKTICPGKLFLERWKQKLIKSLKR